MSFYDQYGKPFIGYLNSITSGIPKLIFPPVCIVCDNLFKDEPVNICSDCQQRLEPTNRMDWVEDVSHNSHIDHAFSGWYFNEIFQNVIHSFKYQGRPKFAFEFGCFLANEMLLQDGFDSMDCIIPVPLHSMKYRSRGYNQAYWIGKGVGVTLDIPVIRKGIVKTQHTSSQTSLNLEEREKNVAGVFKCKLDLSGMHVWIVDDVLTTGSTISSVAKACKSAGAKCVTALTLCTPKIKGKK